MQQIPKKDFQRVLERRLGRFWNRAMVVFKNYGENWAVDVTIALNSAEEQGKIEEVLGMMERHWQRHLQYEKPENRGDVRDLFGNPTKRMFVRIFQEVLEIKPVWMELSA